MYELTPGAYNHNLIFAHRTTQEGMRGFLFVITIAIVQALNFRGQSHVYEAHSAQKQSLNTYSYCTCNNKMYACEKLFTCRCDDNGAAVCILLTA